MRKNSVKNRRINDEVMRALARIIRTIKDPRVSPMTSIMSSDATRRRASSARLLPTRRNLVSGET